MKKGVLIAAGAYIIWGVLPIYWKALAEVPAAEILTHRIIWSLSFVLILLAIRKDWSWIRKTLRSPRVLLAFAFSATLLGVNWFTYIWGVNAGFIVETSLGYFINPLVYVLLGLVFLQERLRSGQWIAVGFAVGGVAYLTFVYGSLPWIALILAFSFGTYGLLRKTARLGSLQGLSLEMAILFLPATGYLLYLERAGQGALGHSGWETTLLLIGAGVVTAVPLLLFARGAREIPLTMIGVLQYIAPTLQFLIGVFLYDEPFNLSRLAGFVLIWLALVIYTLEGIIQSKQHGAWNYVKVEEGSSAG